MFLRVLPLWNLVNENSNHHKFQNLVNHQIITLVNKIRLKIPNTFSNKNYCLTTVAQPKSLFSGFKFTEAFFFMCYLSPEPSNLEQFSILFFFRFLYVVAHHHHYRKWNYATPPIENSSNKKRAVKMHTRRIDTLNSGNAILCERKLE